MKKQKKQKLKEKEWINKSEKIDPKKGGHSRGP